MTVIEIVQENQPQQTLYRAIGGDQQAIGSTPGQALDSLTEMLATTNRDDEGELLVIMQRFRPDVFFNEQQQSRLQELMSRFHEVGNDLDALSSEERQELEQLVDAEWQAAIERSAAILKRISPSNSE
jgi:hypothetical protein